MTVIVGLVGAEGAVMASDSEGTEDVHSRRDVEKCWTCGGLLIGLSGTSSIKQPMEAVLAKEVKDAFGKEPEIPRWKARDVIRTAVGPVLKREYENYVPPTPNDHSGAIASSLLVAGRDADGYWLLEIAPDNQPTFYTEHGFHTIGTGSAAAYVAQGLLKGYEPGQRSLDHLKLVAYRTVDTCINVMAGTLGVGGYVQLYGSRDGDPFEKEDDEGIERLANGLQQWTTLESESLNRVVLGGTASPAEGEGEELPEELDE